ncbi:MAG: undecaprenyldiphospho-muramoylpentapeptide beta-N-acetylglucosaminyltransferase [Candidatus Nealsonbacteria bacterium]|nr:undecaprenyldiphospho-muramoylpentapeptide beta-N-acetylglucosaminyltransferase [Candidatus Nealsonbacteria bacterium]
MKILFTGGGTAGHIFPIIAIIREMKRNYPESGFEFFYLGPKDKFIKKILSQEGIEVKTVLAGKLRRYFSFQNIIDVFKIPLGIFQAFYHIFVISPDLIFSKGGYGSFPTVFSGWLLRTPIFLHESDVSPGLTNKITSRFALEIFTAFPVEKTEYFPAQKMIAVGSPIRQKILTSPVQPEMDFKLAGGKPVILILGGSQGAQRINDFILLALPDLLENFEVIHQTGQANLEQVKKEVRAVIKDDLIKYYHPEPFLDEEKLSCAYGAADLIISRSGAGTIFEIAALAKPSVLIPLPESAQNHQVKNGYAFAEDGAALVIEEANLGPNFFLERLKYLFSQPETLKEMSQKAKEFSRPQAAEIIAGYIFGYLTQ